MLTLAFVEEEAGNWQAVRDRCETILDDSSMGRWSLFDVHGSVLVQRGIWVTLKLPFSILAGALNSREVLASDSWYGHSGTFTG